MRARQSLARTIFFHVVLAGLPAVLIASISLLGSSLHIRDQLTLGMIIGGFWFGFAWAARTRVVRALQVTSNLLSALREGDFSIRAGLGRHPDALNSVFTEINALGDTLSQQRLEATEATALLNTVMQKIEVAIFAFDEKGILRLVNESGAELLATRSERLKGHTAGEIGLRECLEGEPSRILKTTRFPGASGRWGLRRTTFRAQGLPHTLVVIGDLSRELREEEIRAWQRLVRVLGHELNNSLAPIKSISGSLRRVLTEPRRPDDWEVDAAKGLEIIESRAASLGSFIAAYTQLAKLHAPDLRLTPVAPLIRRVAALETRAPVTVLGGPELTLKIDPAQIEQALINLLRNAVDAANEADPASPSVVLSWIRDDGCVEMRIADNGPGIANWSNLFTPYFTTKPGGSGIGLVLCRQIAENHGGSVSLENDPGGIGCIARLRLPLQ